MHLGIYSLLYPKYISTSIGNATMYSLYNDIGSAKHALAKSLF